MADQAHKNFKTQKFREERNKYKSHKRSEIIKEQS